MAVEVPEDAPAPGLDGDIAADLVMQISDDDDDDSSDGSSVGENDDVEIIEAEENDDAESTDDESSEMPELKLEDAEFAGGSESQECTLIFTQGLSTTIVALDGVASLKGWQFYGVYPPVGELLNVREANSYDDVMRNPVFKSIIKALGLEVNKEYTSTECLRYGRVVIMTAEEDHYGSYIKGLLINFLHMFWPSLLKLPSFLAELIAPLLVKATKVSEDGKEKHVFYSLPEYEAWRESLRGNASGWAIEKDVAGFDEGDVGMDYFKKLLRKKKDFVWVDERDDEAIELAFSKKFEDSPIDDLIKEAIVAEFADYVATVSSRPVCELSAYYHDRQSLDSTIIEMAQACVGSKNINLLEMARQLGEDNHLSIQFSPITRFLFPKDDDKLLDYLHEDGISIEPTWYLPIIPTVLVNGFEGTGPAGWTSYIPSYNPRDIVANMKRLINDDKMAPMVPWYRGFTGTIEKTVTDSGVCYTTCGIIKREDESTLKITELPIGSCIKDYLEFLGSISEVHGLAEDHMIKGYEDFSNIDVDILIHLSDTVKNLKEASKEDLCKTFKLTSIRSMSNMHLFNPKGEIKRYDTPEQILEEFFHLRLQFYEKRKTALLLTLRSHLSKLENKVALMSGVLDGGVVDVNKLSTDLYLKAMSIITLVSRDSCPEMLQVLLADIDRINLKVKKLEGSTPRTLWLEELAALELELDKLEKQKFIGLHLPVLHWKQMKMDVAAVPRLQQQSELQKLLHMVEELNSK